MRKGEYTLETFEQELARRFPQNHIKVLEFNGTAKYIKYKCLDCGKIYEKSRANHMYENKTLCQKCYTGRNSLERNWILDFVKNSKQFDFAEPWNNAVTVPISLHCNNCNRTFKKQAGNMHLKNESTICPYCGDNGFPVTKEDYIKSLSEEKQQDYKILNYTAKGKKVTFQHKCGFVFSQIGINFIKSKGCPKCFGTRSKGELKIEEFLIKNNISYEIEKNFKNLPHLFFDFYLPQYNLLIEYQGEQHYFPVNIFGGEKHFKRQQELDEIKRQYVKQNNFNYAEIPYTEYDNLNSYLLNLLSSTTSSLNVASSEAKEKTSILDDKIV